MSADAVSRGEMILRRLLWSMHATPGDGHGLYGDDGELQCSGSDGACDFRRDSAEQIEEHINRRVRRLRVMGPLE